MVAIGVLLLILNWFFHKVYWSDHLATLHGRKKRILNGAGLSVAAAQLVGLAILGFTAVYREGFETVLFLQALVLDAGAANVAEGVVLGGAAVAAVGVLTISLQRKLPHRRMLEITGLLILSVLVIMVGKTDPGLPGRRLGSGASDRRPASSVLGRPLVRRLPDLGRPRCPGRRRCVRPRKLWGRRMDSRETAACNTRGSCAALAASRAERAELTT